MFHLHCFDQICNIETTNKIHFNFCDEFYSPHYHQHVSTSIVAIFRVVLLLQQYKYQMWLAVSLSLHNN